MSLNIKALRAAIAKSNKRFATMTPAQKRVRIAKDVIDQLNAEEIVAKNGTYFSHVNDNRIESENGDASVQELAKNDFLGCQVCAIGAGFIAAVKRLDKLKVEDLLKSDSYGGHIDDDDMVDYLVATGAFTAAQARKLEKVFERHGSYFSGENEFVAGHANFTADIASDASGNTDSDAIMRRVWGFIIKNKGSLNFPKDKRRHY